MGRPVCYRNSSLNDTMKKVLVTGATGFIGQYVINNLLKQHVKIIATSRNADENSFSNHSKIIAKSFDLHNPEQPKNLYNYFEQPDIIIHLAWEGLPNYKEDFHVKKNLPAHKAFLSNLIEHGATDITVAGTCFEYGMQEGELAETMAAQPGNFYATAKNELRIWLKEFKNISLKWPRLFYMYGAGQNPKSLIPQLEAALQRGDPVFNMSGGEQTRDFLHVNKVAESIIAIALQQAVTGVINVSSGNPIKVKDFVSNYLHSINKTIELNLGFYPYPDFEPMHFWGNNEKLKSIKDINE